ncbi:formyltetrahydrofolate deformylase [Candidatus Woesearchaeota archaeon]|nr:formyltetrahydrofolate deformylase [Candidatus Woesearchaeota archaeon]
MGEYTLLFRCNDRKGVLDEITKFVTEEHNGNFGDVRATPWEGQYAVRAEFESNSTLEQLTSNFDEFVDGTDRWVDISDRNVKKKVAILVSKQMHCLKYLLNSWEEGDLNIDVPLIISNHPDASNIAHRHGINFFYVPASPENRKEAEARILDLVKREDTDLIVTARYMQIITANMLNNFGKPFINVHHGNVAAFPGAKPYHQAYARGVKDLHPTAHYMIEEVDKGPIIMTEEIHVEDTDTVQDYIRKGKQGECIALLRAVDLHANNRIITYNNKTLRFQ